MDVVQDFRLSFLQTIVCRSWYNELQWHDMTWFFLIFELKLFLWYIIIWWYISIWQKKTYRIKKKRDIGIEGKTMNVWYWYKDMNDWEFIHLFIFIDICIFILLNSRILWIRYIYMCTCVYVYIYIDIWIIHIECIWIL